MTEQIISNLANLSRLKVISRTSVMKYKGTKKTIPEIGGKLNVAHILEGSVRKYGDQIRVTAQLISTKDDFHIWSENYDKQYQELFEIQDNVSEHIAKILLTKISGGEISAIKTTRTGNIEAYEYFLRAKHTHYEESTRANLEKDMRINFLQRSIELFKKSISLDPNFADNYAGLADVYNSLYNVFSENEKDSIKNWRLQEAYLDTALQLNPQSAEAYFVKNYLHQSKIGEYTKKQEFEKIEKELDMQYNCLNTAIIYNSNHLDAHKMMAIFLSALGLDKTALKYVTRAHGLDPLDDAVIARRGALYLDLGEYAKAEADFKKVLSSYPDARNTPYRYARLLIMSNKLAEAEIILEDIEARFPDANTNWEHGLIYALKGEKEKALEIYKDKSAALFAILGMNDDAIEGLTSYSERQLKQKKSQYYFIKNNPHYNNIRSDPRFLEILAKHKALYEENLRKYGEIEL